MLQGLQRATCTASALVPGPGGVRFSGSLPLGEELLADLVSRVPAAMLGLERLLARLPVTRAVGAPLWETRVSQVHWGHLVALLCPMGRVVAFGPEFYLPTLELARRVEEVLRAAAEGWLSPPFSFGRGVLSAAVSGICAEMAANTLGGAQPPLPVRCDFGSLAAAYAAVPAQWSHGASVPTGTAVAATMELLWSALAQLFLLRGEYEAFAHLAAAVVPGALAGRRVRFCSAMGAASGPFRLAGEPA